MISWTIYCIAAIPVLGMLAASTAYSLRLTPHTKVFRFEIDVHKVLAWTGNILLACWIAFLFYLHLSPPIETLFKAISNQQSISSLAIRSIFSMFLVAMITFTGTAMAAASFFSIFICNITKSKRILLLILCLIPPLLTFVSLLIQPKMVILQLGLGYSFIAWLMNGATIIWGKHSLTFAFALVDKLVYQKQRKKCSGLQQ